MLTVDDRTALRTRCESLSLKGLEDLAAYCVRQNRPDAAKYVREIIKERQIQVQARAVPFEVAGSRAPTNPEPAPGQAQPAPYWTPYRIKYAFGVAAGIFGAVGVTAFVIIPALIALANAVVSAVVVAAPWVAGFILSVIVIRSAFFGEKKTYQFPAENPGRNSGTVYNIYIGDGQNVRVNPGGQEPGKLP